MGVLEAVALSGALLGGGAKIYGGIEANRQARKQARIAEEEAGIEAARTKEEAESFASSQRASFSASGVKLEGSPLLVLEETRRTGIRNANNIRSSGRSQGRAIRAQGRAALTKGLFGGIGSGLSGGAKAFGLG